MRLQDIRHAHGLTQAQLASKAGVSRVTIARLETYANRPSLATLNKLARALGITLDELSSTSDRPA